MWVWTILTCPGNPREKNDCQICMYPCLYLCMHAFTYVKLFLVGKCHYVIGPPFSPPSRLKAQKGFQTSFKPVSERFKVIVPDTQKEQVRNVGKCIGEIQIPSHATLVFFPSSGHAASRACRKCSPTEPSDALGLSHSSYNLCRCRTGLGKLSSGHFRFVAEGLHKSRIVCRQGHGQTSQSLS